MKEVPQQLKHQHHSIWPKILVDPLLRKRFLQNWQAEMFISSTAVCRQLAEKRWLYITVTARLGLPVSHRFKQLACKVWPPVVANSSHHGTIMVSADSREPRGARQRSNARKRISVKGKNENT